MPTSKRGAACDKEASLLKASHTPISGLCQPGAGFSCNLPSSQRCFGRGYSLEAEDMLCMQKVPARARRCALRGRQLRLLLGGSSHHISPSPRPSSPPGLLRRLFLEPKSLTREKTLSFFLSAQLVLDLLGLLTHLQALDFSLSRACLF